MAPYSLPKAGANGGAPWRKVEFHGILFCSAASLTTPFSQVTITVKEDSVSWNLRKDIMSDSAVRATETAKGGIKYELVLSEPSVNDPPKKESITSPPKAMSVEEIEQKLKAAEERRLQLEAEKLNQINEKKNKLQEANQKRQEYNNNFIQSTKESLEQKMETFENNREAKLKALQEKLKEHERHIEEVRQSKTLNLNDGTEETTHVASSG